MLFRDFGGGGLEAVRQDFTSFTLMEFDWRPLRGLVTRFDHQKILLYQDRLTAEGQHSSSIRQALRFSIMLNNSTSLAGRILTEVLMLFCLQQAQKNLLYRRFFAPGGEHGMKLELFLVNKVFPIIYIFLFIVK